MLPIHRRNTWPPEAFDHPQFIASLAKWYKPTLFVEYGLREGACTKVYAPFCKKIYGVDLQIDPSLVMIPNLHTFQMSTREFKSSVLDSLDEPIDMAFIDADHTSSVTFQDFEDLFPKMSENGIIFLHDTFPCEAKYMSPEYSGDSWKVPDLIKKKYGKICDVFTIPIQPGLTMVRKYTTILPHFLGASPSVSPKESRADSSLPKEEIEPISEDEYQKIMKEAQVHLKSLMWIAMIFTETPEGNIYLKDNSFSVDSDKVNLQKNLMTLAKKSRDILEVGFNMGHSALFMLLANPECRIDCFDICSHPYVEHCFNYLNGVFPGRLTLYKGDSRETLCQYEKKVDLCHIDGCHDYIVANLDFFNTYNKCRTKGFIVFDDVWLLHLKSLWSGYISSGMIREVKMLDAGHAIGQPNRKEHKIAVATLVVGEEYKRFTRYGRLTKVKYCEKQGYDFREDEDAYDPTRPYAWSKVRLIQKCLGEKTDSGNSRYDYVVWVDADTHIMNPDVILESLITRLSGGRDILLASDWDKINSGVMFIKNTDWSKKFFEVLYTQTDFLNHPNWEQEAIIHMYDTNMLDSQTHIMKLPPAQQTEFNSYYGMYHWGQFIIHLAGCYRDDRNNGLDRMMDAYCPLKMTEETEENYRNRRRYLESL